MRFIPILAVMLMTAVATSAKAASFDCTKATAEVEKLICGDRQANDLDRSLADAYTALRAQVQDRAKLQEEQRTWLKTVLNRCTTIDCLRTAYIDRLHDLNGYGKTVAAEAGHPRCFWMENYSSQFRWVDAGAVYQKELTKTECFQLDSCDGGQGMSSGGCYKWATSAEGQRLPW